MFFCVVVAVIYNTKMVNPTQQPRSTEAPEKTISIEVPGSTFFTSQGEKILRYEAPGKTIELSPNEWKKLGEDLGFSQEVEERKSGRVIMVHRKPLPQGEREDLKISAREYIDFRLVHPGFVTPHTLVDKGAYWVSCRETFKFKEPMPVNLSTYNYRLDLSPFAREMSNPTLGKKEQLKLLHHYQSEVAATRSLLNTRF